MFIPNVFNVFLVLGSTFDVVTVGLSEGIAGASDPLGASDSDRSDPSDPSCLLTINATSLNEKVELEEDDDYMKRWAESYLKESASNAARNLIGVFIETILKGILGSIVNALFQAFWPSSLPSKEESLLKIVFDWTKNYVGKQIADTVVNQTKNELTHAHHALSNYKFHQEKLVKHAAEQAKKIFGKFPMDDWIPAENFLNHAAGEADRVRTKLGPNASQSHETLVAGIPTYMSAVALSMTLYRELYDLTVFKETWPHNKRSQKRLLPGGLVQEGSQTKYLTSGEIVKKMEKRLDTINEEAAGLIEVWRSWRIREGSPTPRVWVKEQWCEPKPWDASAAFRLEDQKLGRGWTFGVYQGTEEQRHCPIPKFEEFTSVLHKMYERKLFVEEVVPLFKPYTTLQRLIPGREDAKLKPSLLPEKVTFGPFSSWLSNTAYLSTKEWDSADVNKEVYIYGDISEIWVRSTETKVSEGLSELGMRVQYGHKFNPEYVKFPNKANKGPQHDRKLVPRKTCGLDVSYAWDRYWSKTFMTQFAAMNAKNQSEVWRSEKDKKWKRTNFMATGRGLCGVYKLGRMNKFLKDADSTGQPFEIEFHWDDDPDSE